MLTIRNLILAICIMGLAIGLSSAVQAAPPAGKITLQIEGFKNTKGTAIISVYDKEDGFPKIPKAMKSMTEPVKDKSMQVVIADLPPGEYAIGIVHDENEDGKLGQWLFVGPPKEGVGTSNNPSGMPKFEEAKFVLADQDIEVNIKMRYVGKKGE